jgi:hypothetical protein
MNSSVEPVHRFIKKYSELTLGRAKHSFRLLRMGSEPVSRSVTQQNVIDAWDSLTKFEEKQHLPEFRNLTLLTLVYVAIGGQTRQRRPVKLKYIKSA